MEITLLSRLEAIEAPYAGATLGEMKAVRWLNLEPNGKLVVVIGLSYPVATIEADLKRQIEAALSGGEGVVSVEVTVESKILPRRVQPGVPRLTGVSNVIAITSGKGGVGKSTTAVNLALALQAGGAKVGVLDADVHGPSLPAMLGVDEASVDGFDETHMIPIIAHGLTMMSVGLLVESDTPMIWRGPMVSQVFEKLLRNTAWGKLDYLIVDMPPGTGDVQISLAQKVPLTGVVVVTTPQTVAINDASRCLRMFEKVYVPVLGLVENMNSYCCPSCGTEARIFGIGGSETMTERYGVELLGSLPIDISIGAQTEAGKPILVAAPESPAAKCYREIAMRLSAKLAKLDRDSQSAFPKIVVENVPRKT